MHAWDMQGEVSGCTERCKQYAWFCRPTGIIVSVQRMERLGHGKNLHNRRVINPR